MTDALTIAIAVLAALPAAMIAVNLIVYTRQPRDAGEINGISVLIPARDEEEAIEEAVRSVLDSERVIPFEVVVMDDHSTDRTAAIVEKIAAEDPRVRLAQAPRLPRDWFGKPHACWCLAREARHDTLVWMDADVRLRPGGLRTLANALHHKEVALVSTVPLQQTRTLAEKLIVPQILYVLLGYLPMARMKQVASPAYGAACGQLMAARRDDYFAIDGHKPVRNLMHESLALARAFRRQGRMTDLIDGTKIATCRMYRTAGEVWHGFAKNAHEGMGAPAAIAPWTLLLLGAQVLPWLLLPLMLLGPISTTPLAITATAVAVVSAVVSTLAIGIAFRQGPGAILLRPLGIAMLLAIQWYALIRHLAGRPITWRGRAYAAANG
ncbi:glycosyltransferase [Mucisphaera calidilacus]|uniref:4,4'-diaponeurosporenoate glycosyltransferase n=1 Tax=Mucisphaera calidilacus TaxID=2527982 RepID=A0A518BV40_9BACT|nr:glycosyltransferase [Mucisphaera calidilacus]QDU70804.1 4,4'-diaponeurosporenoate glycosyltransferase [Mucisphaera calidilacus]